MKSFSEYYYSQNIHEEGVRKWLSAAALGTSLLTTPLQASNNNLSDTSKITSYISSHEGYKENVYLCKGIPHIGIGHKLVPTDKELFNKIFNGTIDYNLLLNGTLKLNKSQVLTLFNYDLNRFINLSKQKYSNFDKLPNNIKIALVDSAFRGEKHPKTDKLINLGKYKEAAKAYLDDAEYRQAKNNNTGIARRMEENAKLIASGASQLNSAQFASSR